MSASQPMSGQTSYLKRMAGQDLPFEVLYRYKKNTFSDKIGFCVLLKYINCHFWLAFSIIMYTEDNFFNSKKFYLSWPLCWLFHSQSTFWMAPFCNILFKIDNYNLFQNFKSKNDEVNEYFFCAKFCHHVQKGPQIIL